MVRLVLLIPLLASFLTALFLLPVWIKRAKNARLSGKDIHKVDAREVAEAGGVNVVAGFSLGILLYIAINTFLFNNSEHIIEIFSLMTSVLLISFVAFTDDILGWKIGLRRRTRMILVAFSSIPLIAINAGREIVWVPFVGSVDLGLIYPLILIPIGIVGATTTYNFLAGFNGLEAGQGIIILLAMSFVVHITGNSWLAVVGLCMVAALLAFMIYNFYPATVFPGDTLTYSVGALVAIMSIIGNFEKVAVFFFIPFILETVLKLRGSLVKESFARLLPDGSLGLRYDKLYSLNHVSIYLMQRSGIKPTEMRVVASLWVFQIFVILLGIFLFRGGIF